MKRATTIGVLLSLSALAPAHADVVLDWNAIALTTMASQNPFAQARLMAITQLAVFEAVNACTGEHEPYLGQVVAPAGASAEAAAIVAAHDVLRNYFPDSVSLLEASRDQSLSGIPAGQARTAGRSVGAAAAAAMIALRANDGSAPPQTYSPSTTDPGAWQPTPPGLGPGILLHWRNVAPFAVHSSDWFRSDPPPDLRSRRYRKDYDEVKRAGALDSVHRPQHRSDVARYFNVAGAAHVWNSVARQVSVEQTLSLAENARALALLNMAISDGLVSSMESKYHYLFWRPVTAIRAGDTDGNPWTRPDADWTPFITTPSFPSYPSAHASASHAARAIVERIFGRGRHHVTLTHPGIADVTLSYTRFRDVTDDVDDARVYGGIHFRFDQRAGGWQGRLVGSYVHRHYLRPLHACDR
jgi:hypothetical protein